MKTFALRFSDNYAPKDGMIFHHQQLIDKYNYVWYGKFGNNISKEILNEQLKTNDPKFLLIKSGGIERYWVHFVEYKNQVSELEKIPDYYRNSSSNINNWFKVTKFEKTDKDVLSKCFVLSSGDCLSIVSKHSMNPYFKIDYRGEKNE